MTEPQRPDSSRPIAAQEYFHAVVEGLAQHTERLGAEIRSRGLALGKAQAIGDIEQLIATWREGEVARALQNMARVAEEVDLLDGLL